MAEFLLFAYVMMFGSIVLGLFTSALIEELDRRGVLDFNEFFEGRQ